MRVRILAALASVLCVAACSGGDDAPSSSPFDGVYEVTGQTENDEGCATEGAPVTPIDPFFELNKTDFFGQPILGYFHCTDALTCDDDPDLFGSFHEKRDGNWTGVIKFASYSGAYCLMGETLRTLTGDPDAAVEIRSIMSTTSDAGVSETECLDSDLDELIDDHRDDLVCENLDVLDATRVPEE